MIRCSSVFGSAPVANPGIKIRSAARASLMFSGLTFKAERLRPAAQLVQNKLTDRRAEVRSSAELGRRKRLNSQRFFYQKCRVFPPKTPEKDHSSDPDRANDRINLGPKRRIEPNSD